ncbi:MAG: hypothetical protein K2G13_03450, partial [Muribaculaceae bacterium]|nr:hypothetical protein [Muribaculaceae bacterium]
MKRIFILVLVGITMSLMNLLASSFDSVAAQYSNISGNNQPTVSWQLLSGDDNNNRCIERYIVNNADSVKKLCFTQLPRPKKAISEGDSVVEINAGYYYL